LESTFILIDTILRSCRVRSLFPGEDMLKEKVYWQDTVEMPNGEPQDALPAKIDVAIIGGGYTGLSAALTLARQGVDTLVLEAENPGWGGSSRNGGMVLTGLKIPMQTAIKRYGRDDARRLFQCSLDSIDTVEQIIKREKIVCGFERTGHLLTANKPGHYEALAAEVDFMAGEFNHNVRLVSPEKQRDEIGSDLYHGALLDETSAGLNPAQFASGLAGAASIAGAGIHPGTRALQIQRNGTGFQVGTTRGPVQTGTVLVASNGYIDSAIPELQRKIIPIGSFIIATEPLSDELAKELIPHRRMIFDYKHFLNYFRLSDDNRMIFGGRAAFFPENARTVRQSAVILQREMIEVYPQLRDVKIEYVWGGTLGFAFDQMPHAGQQDGIYFALGYAGHGVAMATYLGKTVAEAMVEGTIKQHPFAAYPFPGAPMGLYNETPWFLPFVGAFHKILDWLD
jgi:glycine/D-amino acid oxidase-like deaminating enzyme